jgi:hypothetical protein
MWYPAQAILQIAPVATHSKIEEYQIILDLEIITATWVQILMPINHDAKEGLRRKRRWYTFKSTLYIKIYLFHEIIFDKTAYELFLEFSLILFYLLDKIHVCFCHHRQNIFICTNFEVHFHLWSMDADVNSLLYFS